MRPRHPRAIYSDANDKKLMEVFLEHKQEGNGTDNGGWKSKAITAAVAALAGSELESGGAPKSATSIRDHWDHLKRDFHNISTLLEKSGWGWDEENQCVQADDEQGKSFPIYHDMKELLEGALATGANAFRAGKDNSDSDTSSESAKVLKRKVAALGERPVPKKRSRDRTGRSSTAHSISDMSRAIENVAVAMNSDNGTSEKETKKLAYSSGNLATLLLQSYHDVHLLEPVLQY
ncbi:hypothetical protein K435DRAFT_799469 [Dendrothele bispora CBS 962.96]|uniref:Myb/SANT-like domain-containing protein n=1 Tax=Dendrothele bispora (strain CBS 962.96) TaxID=1314807 RepID=A0A4S8LVS0_DENBC|nr:hypothetical protein K435DRAFT_799469 [Dendrothele bispora CBS 962.96]